jgi:probable HAF family extracellular repeat protein
VSTHNELEPILGLRLEIRQARVFGVTVLVALSLIKTLSEKKPRILLEKPCYSCQRLVSLKSIYGRPERRIRIRAQIGNSETGMPFEFQCVFGVWQLFRRKRTMSKKILILQVAVLVLASPPSRADILYELIDLGPCHAREFPVVNNSGQVAGTSGNRAFLWEDGAVTDLGTLGGSSSSANGINDAGEVVGSSRDADGNTVAFRWDGNSGMVPLEKIEGTWSNIALAINNHGDIVGNFMMFIDVNSVPGLAIAWRAFRYTKADGIIDLGTLGGTYSAAFSVNDSGQIAGLSNQVSGLVTGRDIDRAFLWENGEMFDLGTIEECDHSAALSINDHGQIVGHAGESIYSGLRAVLIDPSGSGENTELGSIEGHSTSVALSINNKGQIVGSTHMWEAASQRAILFDSTGGAVNTDLNDLIYPGIGWTLSAASSINDRGWIVGEMHNDDWERHGFLLRPIPYAVAIDNVEDAVDDKLEALDRISAAIERERAAIEALDGLLASGELGDLSERDMLRVKWQIRRAIFGERLCKLGLDRTRRRLAAALALLKGEAPPPDRPIYDIELERADVNADGVVDFRDVAVVMKHWLEPSGTQ